MTFSVKLQNATCAISVQWQADVRAVNVVMLFPSLFRYDLRFMLLKHLSFFFCGFMTWYAAVNAYVQLVARGSSSAADSIRWEWRRLRWSYLLPVASSTSWTSAVEWITEFSLETERQEGRKERRNKETRNVRRAQHFWRFGVTIATTELFRTLVTVVVTVTVEAFA